MRLNTIAPLRHGKKKPKQEGRFKVASSENLAADLMKIINDVRAGHDHGFISNMINAWEHKRLVIARNPLRLCNCHQNVGLALYWVVDRM